MVQTSYTCIREMPGSNLGVAVGFSQIPIPPRSHLLFDPSQPLKLKRRLYITEELFKEMRQRVKLLQPLP